MQIRRGVNRGYTERSIIIGLMRVLVALALTHAFTGRLQATRPNIVLVISDDQAWSDYGFMGHAEIATPNLDALAERSLLFERGYVAAPICRPSLASIVTGLFPSQHGVTGNDVDGHANRAVLDPELRKRFYEHPHLVEFLVSRGYLALQTGKWWEGSYRDAGFTHGMTHGDPQRGGRHGDAGLRIGRQGIGEIEEFFDHAREEEKPFFLWYAPFLPHTPHNPPPELLAKYADPNRPTDEAKYYAMCEWFDATCGELMDALEERQLVDNTLVLYIADNGWAPTSRNADDPHQKVWNRFALRSKTSPYENGIRTPIMVAWPGKIEPSQSESFAHAIDFFPTIADAIGADAPEGLTGISLLDESAIANRKRVFGVTHATHNMSLGNPNDTLQYLWCIDQRWKLILRQAGKDTTQYRVLHEWDDVPYRLYDIVQDPGETNDLSSEYPQVVDELKRAIAEWSGSLEMPYQHAKPASPNKQVVYKSTPQGELRLHLFQPTVRDPAQRRPAAIFFFGGGWRGGSPRQFYPHCAHLAEKGMVAISAEYRVENQHGTSPRECVSDAKSAIRWIKAHADELGIDPEKIVAGGGSAGGHLAAACGTLDAFDDEGDNLAFSPVPAALVLFNPVIDNGPGQYSHRRVKEYWEQFSPRHNLSATTPPTIFFLGKQDKLISVATAKSYQQAMEELGVPCQLHLYDKQQHGFFNFDYRAYYEATVSAMDRFLEGLGYLGQEGSHGQEAN